MRREIEIRPIEGKAYSQISINEDGKTVFIGLMDSSPNGHFGLAAGKEMAGGGSVVIFFIDRRILWARDATSINCIHVTDHGVVAFLDGRHIVIADINGEILKAPFGPPCSIDSFRVGPDGFYVSAGLTRWRAGYDGGLVQLPSADPPPRPPRTGSGRGLKRR